MALHQVDHFSAATKLWRALHMGQGKKSCLPAREAIWRKRVGKVGEVKEQDQRRPRAMKSTQAQAEIPGPQHEGVRGVKRERKQIVTRHRQFHKSAILQRAIRRFRAFSGRGRAWEERGVLAIPVQSNQLKRLLIDHEARCAEAAGLHTEPSLNPLEALEDLTALLVASQGGEFPMGEGMGGDLMTLSHGLLKKLSLPGIIEILGDRKERCANLHRFKELQCSPQARVKERVIVTVVRPPMGTKDMRRPIEVQVDRSKRLPRRFNTRSHLSRTTG